MLVPSLVARWPPTVDLVMGYDKSNTSMLLKRFLLARMTWLPVFTELQNLRATWPARDDLSVQSRLKFFAEALDPGRVGSFKGVLEVNGDRVIVATQVLGSVGVLDSRPRGFRHIEMTARPVM